MRQRFGVSPLFFSLIFSPNYVVKAGNASLMRTENGKCVAVGEYANLTLSTQFIFSDMNPQTVSIDFRLICGPEISRMCGSPIASLAVGLRLMLSMDVLDKRKISFSHIPTKEPFHCCCGLWPSTLFSANMQCIPGVKI